MRKPKLRELKEAVISLISKPYTTNFPYKPHIPAERFRGRPKYNEDECVGCGACFQVCPSKAIELTDEVTAQAGKRTLIHHPDMCIFCGECERNCITKEGIKLTNMFDVSYFNAKDVKDSVEHKLAVCLNCGDIIGAEKHILWLLKKLGSLAFAQPVIISQLTAMLEIQTNGEEKIVPPLQRTDMLKLVCPKCRRIAFLSDEKKE